MSTDDNSGRVPQNKLVEVVMPPERQLRMQKELAELAEMGAKMAKINEEFIPTAGLLRTIAEPALSVTHYLQSANSAFESMKKLIEPSSSLLALQKSAIGTIFDTIESPSFLSSIKSVMDMSVRYQDMWRDLALKQMDYFSTMNFSSLIDRYDETPVYVPPRRDPPVTHVHVHIEKLIVHRDGRPAVVVPEEGCIELDPYFYLCYKPDEKRYGLYYFKNARWNFEELTALPVRLLRYLHDVGLRPRTYAQKLDAIADALQSSKGSISNRIKGLQRMSERLKIQDLLQKVGEDRWCLSRQLECFEGMWL